MSLPYANLKLSSLDLHWQILVKSSVLFLLSFPEYLRRAWIQLQQVPKFGQICSYYWRDSKCTWKHFRNSGDIPLQAKDCPRQKSWTSLKTCLLQVSSFLFSPSTLSLRIRAKSSLTTCSSIPMCNQLPNPIVQYRFHQAAKTQKRWRQRPCR